jgi:deazaflavin-dependent oxidoreductase (nitroreductase family)
VGNSESPPPGGLGKRGGAPLRHVDPHAHHGPIHRAYVRIAGGRFATRLARQPVWGAIVWKLDPHLLGLTKGRLGTGLSIPTALLQTRGARTGRLRRNAVIYFHDGQRVTIIASQAGLPGNPSWYYNVRAHPHDVMLGGQRFRAEIVEDETERARLWELADLVFPGFPAYRESAARTGRAIPIVQLLPGRSAAPDFIK